MRSSRTAMNSLRATSGSAVASEILCSPAARYRKWTPRSLRPFFYWFMKDFRRLMAPTEVSTKPGGSPRGKSAAKQGFNNRTFAALMSAKNLPLYVPRNMLGYDPVVQVQGHSGAVRRTAPAKVQSIRCCSRAQACSIGCGSNPGVLARAAWQPPRGAEGRSQGPAQHSGQRSMAHLFRVD